MAARNCKQEYQVEYLIDFQNCLRMAEEKYRNTKDPAVKIKGLLKELALFYEADSVCILETDWDLGIAVNTYAYRKEGIIPKAQRFRNLPMDRYSHWADKLRANQPVIITNAKLDEMRKVDTTEGLWEGISHILAEPFTKKHNTGIIIVTNSRKYESSIHFLQLISAMVVANINEIQLQKRTDAALRNIPVLSGSIIHINFFGGLEIQSDKGILTDEDISADQCYRLLVYLLFYHRKTRPVRELADIIWNDNALDDPYHDVKNVVYRLKKSLSIIEADELIIGSSGTFIINPKYQVYTDYERFESICVRYFSSKDDELKACLCSDLQNIYRGTMLPKCDHLHWVIPKISYYHNLYLRIVKDNVLYNLKKHDYIAALLATQKGIEAEPYDTDFVVYQIICMDMQGNRCLAKNYYRRVDRTLTKEQKEVVTQFTGILD